MRQYILVDGEIREADIITVGRFMEEGHHVIRVTHGVRCRISTIFLCLDHDFTGRGPPVLFESMVFDDSGDSVDQERYTSMEEALAGHERLVREWGDLRLLEKGSDT